MQFNGDANHQDLVTLANRFAKTNDNRYPLTEKAQDATEGEKIVWSWIWEAYNGWGYDDSNQSTLPEATRDLPADTQFIVFPDEIQDLMGVDWQDSGGNWNKLLPITLEEIKDKGQAETEFEKIPGNPIWYRPVANGFKLYPAADTARTQALRIQVSRPSIAFVPSDTTHAPGFASIYHQAIAVYMAKNYADINSLPAAIKLGERWDGNENSIGGSEGGYKKAIKVFYAARYREMFPPTVKHRKNFVSQYI